MEKVCCYHTSMLHHHITGSVSKMTELAFVLYRWISVENQETFDKGRDIYIYKYIYIPIWEMHVTVISFTF